MLNAYKHTKVQDLLPYSSVAVFQCDLDRDFFFLPNDAIQPYSPERFNHSLLSLAGVSSVFKIPQGGC